MAVTVNVEDKLVSLTTIETVEFCEDCKGTGKRKITFEDCFSNPMPEKTDRKSVVWERV